MKKRLHLYIIILTLDIFLLPTLTYACGTKSEKECCKKEVSSKSEKKECCKSNQSKDENNSCGGKCGNSKCGCVSTCSSFSSNLGFDTIFKNNAFNFSTVEKSRFSKSSPSISDGFYSIWLIPKIS